MLSNVFAGRSDGGPTTASGEGGMTTALPAPTSIASKRGGDSLFLAEGCSCVSLALPAASCVVRRKWRGVAETKPYGIGGVPSPRPLFSLAVVRRSFVFSAQLRQDDHLTQKNERHRSLVVVPCSRVDAGPGFLLRAGAWWCSLRHERAVSMSRWFDSGRPANHTAGTHS